MQDPGTAPLRRRSGVRLRRWSLRLGLALLGVFALVTSASFIYNAATSGREVSASSLYAGPYVTLDGVSVAYREWGTSGSPIVLVHGFAESTWAWHEVAPLLARDHRVFALDLTGFGYTERRGPYTLDAWSHEVAAFIEAMHLSRPLLVGHSLGAAVVADVALKYPGAVSGIVLADGDGLSEGGPPQWLRAAIVNPYFTSMWRLGSSTGWIVRAILTNSYGPNHPPIDEALIQQWVLPLRVQGTEAALFAMAHGATSVPGLSPQQLASVTVPAAMIWGAEDAVDPLSAGQEAAGLLHASMKLLPGAGHLSMLTQPGEFVGAVAAFASSLAPAAVG
jgi:pimeloyl-ACP methyl ester carboxylesterase